VRIRQHAQHAQRLVVFNEPHAAHVGSQLENRVDAFRSLQACVLLLQIQDQILRLWVLLVPVVLRLYVHDANTGGSFIKQPVYEMTTDKPAATTNQGVGATNMHRDIKSFLSRKGLARTLLNPAKDAKERT